MQTIEASSRATTSGPNAQVSENRPQQASSKAVISVRNVSKQFGKNEPTVRDLNFDVQRGQIFCLLGPSGSGKSTTMRMLTGVYKPTTGDVEVLGETPSKFRKRLRTRMGYMPQQFVLFPELTTMENINFMASVYGMSWFGRRKKVKQVLEFVDLWEARNRLASKLSGGMQRRLELASVLVHRPELIFVDEPTAGIDPILRAKFWEHFKGLRDAGRTLFVTTQYVTEADYCDVVAILSRGRLLAIGTPEDIRHRAMGGEVVDLVLAETTSQAVRLLRGLPGIHRIRTLSPEEFRLTVDDATESLKAILELFESHNIEIQSIQPYRPDFEEVFVQLMEEDARLHPDEDEEGKHKDKNHKDNGKQDKNKDKNEPLNPVTAVSPQQDLIVQNPISAPIPPVRSDEEMEKKAELQAENPVSFQPTQNQPGYPPVQQQAPAPVAPDPVNGTMPGAVGPNNFNDQPTIITRPVDVAEPTLQPDTKKRITQPLKSEVSKDNNTLSK